VIIKDCEDDDYECEEDNAYIIMSAGGLKMY